MQYVHASPGDEERSTRGMKNYPEDLGKANLKSKTLFAIKDEIFVTGLTL